MNPCLSRGCSPSSVAALLGTVMCLTTTLAYCAPADVNGHLAVAAANVAHAPVRHEHALTSMFRKGDVFIKVSVNGHPATWMSLDTGTTDSMIDSEYAKTIGLKLTPKTQGTAGFGSAEVPTLTTDTVHLQAGSEPEKVIFFESISLNGMVGPDHVPLAGLLGHSFLGQHVVVIDYLEQEVYFDDTPQPADPRDVAMTLIEGVPYVQLTMANQPVSSLIDSGGSYGAIITPAKARELGVESLMADAMSASTVGHGGNQSIVIGKAPAFSIGGLAVNDLSAAYTTFGTATDALGVGVSLGKVFLRNYKLTLNYPAKTMRLEP